MYCARRSFYIWLAVLLMFSSGAIACLVIALTLHIPRPLNVQGTVTSVGDCEVFCNTFCGHSGNVSIAFTWNSTRYQDSIYADVFCGMDCCESLVDKQTLIYIWIHLSPENIPIPYSASLKLPWDPNWQVNLLLILSFTFLICAVCSFAGTLMSCCHQRTYVPIIN